MGGKTEEQMKSLKAFAMGRWAAPGNLSPPDITAHESI